MTAVVHFAIWDAYLDRSKPQCGQKGDHRQLLDADPANVTCKKCLKIMGHLRGVQA